MTNSRRPRLVLHVADQVDHVYGGLANSIPPLCAALADSGERLLLASLDEDPDASRLPQSRKFPVMAFPGARRFGCSPAMGRWLRRVLESGSVGLVHSHSLWRAPNIVAPALAGRHRIPCIVSPHGTLGDAQFRSGSWAKQAIWRLWQRRALRSATAFHATSPTEAAGIRMRGFSQPIATIPLGFDPAPLQPETSANARTKTVLSLGRLDPVKGIDLLLEAWALVQDRHPDWDLRIVGPDSKGYRAELQSMAARLRLRRVSMEDGIRGTEKWNAMRQASLFAFPSRGENFGLALAEALSAGTPVVASRATPWQHIERVGCGWWVDNSPRLLAEVLAKAMGTRPEMLRQMGEAGSNWIIEEFSWVTCASRMRELYDWVLAGQPETEKPSFVALASLDS